MSDDLPGTKRTAHFPALGINVELFERDEAAWDAMSEQALDQLHLELGRLVVAAGRVDSLLWTICETLSRLGGDEPPYDDDDDDEDDGLAWLGWFRQETVRIRLARYLGETKPVSLMQVKDRRRVILAALGKLNWPEGQGWFKEWFDRFGPANARRNRCIHDPWEQESFSPSWVAVQDGVTGSVVHPGEVLALTVEYVDLREQLSVLSAELYALLYGDD